MNYKVGDKITISKPSKKELEKWSNHWAKSMDEYIGQEKTIKNISQETESFSLSARIYYWPLCMLNNPKEINYEIY